MATSEAALTEAGTLEAQFARLGLDNLAETEPAKPIPEGGPEKREMIPGELLGSLKIEIVSIENLPERQHLSRIASTVFREPARRWTPFVVVSLGARSFKTNSYAQEPGTGPAKVLVAETVPDFAVLQQAVAFDVVFALRDHHVTGDNEAIGTDLSVEIADIVDQAQRDAKDYWETDDSDVGHPQAPGPGVRPVRAPGLRLPKMKDRRLEVQQPPVVKPDGTVEKLPPIVLNVRAGFTPRVHLLRNLLLTILHSTRSDNHPLAKKAAISPAPTPTPPPLRPLTHVTVADAMLLDHENLGPFYRDGNVESIFGNRDEMPVDEFVEAWYQRDWVLDPAATDAAAASGATGSVKKKVLGSLGSLKRPAGGAAPPAPTCISCGLPFPDADPTSSLPLAAQQMDHLLVCASASRFSTSTYLTEDAAARGLYTSWSTYLLTRFGFGTYKVGSVEGHILVQNRETGRLEEEYIPSYVRLGIQLLYRNRVSRSAVEMATVENALKSATMAHGPLYDDPASKAEIPDFIKTYSIDVDEIAKPLSEYANMNDFFSRGLKPGMRKLDSPGDPKVLVSAADCRLTCFPTVTEATKIWVKGTDFTVFQLLGGDAKISKEFQDCTMVIHRLAPQDYHRWHCPVDGRVDKIVPVRIPGHYYTVNPMAVRSTVNVFGENVREVCYVNSPTFGRVAVVAVGAMMVGSIVWLVKEGQQVGRMDEMGLFKFGGSTVILLVKKGIVTLDQDLVANSAKALETVVRVGNRVGIAGSP